MLDAQLFLLPQHVNYTESSLAKPYQLGCDVTRLPAYTSQKTAEMLTMATDCDVKECYRIDIETLPYFEHTKNKAKMVTMETKCNSQPGLCNKITISPWTDYDYILYGLPHDHLLLKISNPNLFPDESIICSSSKRSVNFIYRLTPTKFYYFRQAQPQRLFHRSSVTDKGQLVIFAGGFSRASFISRLFVTTGKKV
jgi:hypothetical protein